MNTRRKVRDLAVDLTSRSRCRVRVAAVLSDNHGIFAWGWNYSGADNLGVCAERHAITRANRRRLAGARLTVAGRYRNTGAPVYAKPCAESCLPLAKKHGIEIVEYTTKAGSWEVLNLRYVRAR